MRKTSIMIMATAIGLSWPTGSHAFERRSWEKPLPTGFHHFQPVPPIWWQEQASDGIFLCREMRNAISFGRQLWLEATDIEAARSLRRAWGGDAPCQILPGLRLRAFEYAVRGDDQNRRILVMKWVDQYGQPHFTGTPFRR